MSNVQESKNISVIIVDDHAVVREGLMAFFGNTEDVSVTTIASTAQEAVLAASEHTPDVILLDLLLPDQPAVQTIEKIKAVSPETKVVVLTSHEGNEYIAEVLKAGALSYVLKDINPGDLIAVVRKAAAGESILNARLAQSLEADFASGRRSLHDSLTEREREVLHCIARGMTNGEMTEHLHISGTTVKTHVSSILGKLYISDRTKLAVYAWENGLIGKSNSF